MKGRNLAGRKLWHRGLALAFLAVPPSAAPVVALAQTAPPQTPPQTLPGTNPTREQVTPTAPAATPPQSVVEVKSDGALTTPPCPLDKYDYDVTLTGVDFVAPGGGAVAPDIADALSGVAAGVPTGPQKLREVCAVRDVATDALRNRGYIASVQIPPQRIEGGRLQLEVVTAHIVEVRVRGDAGSYAGTLDARIEKLKSFDPLTRQDAERVLLLADDIPGLSVQLALRPAGTKPGEVIGDLSISVRRAQLLVNVQNYGSRQLGRETAFARGEIYGLTGLSDMTYIGVQTTFQTREQQVVQAGHQMGIGNNGVTLALGVNYAWSRPDIGMIDLRSNSLLGRFELRAPLIRSLRRSLVLSGGFDYADQRTRVYGAGSSSALNRDRLRTLYARIDGGLKAPRLDGGLSYAVHAGLEVRKGIGIFGATKPQSFTDGYTPSRFEGNAEATVVRGDLDGLVRVGPIFTLFARATGQWASDPLLNFDEFSLGNLTIGRGYDPGANSGDRAIGVTGEVQARVFELPDRLRVILFGFYDNVWLYNLDTGAIENNRSLGSYGGGARLLIERRAYLEATYARPLDPALLLPGATRPPARVLLSLTVQLPTKSR